MKKPKGQQFRRAMALVSNGTSVENACRSTGISTATFYSRRKKESGAGTVVKAPNIEIVGTLEPTLEEQVIASDLTAKAKVKILSTLLLA